MADLDLGQSRSEAFKLISAGAAYTLSLSWQADMVIFNNLTQWTNTAGGLPRSFWFRGQTDAAEAYQQQVIDSAAAQSFNFLNPQTNGFTVADTAGGAQAVNDLLISAVSQADPCVITTTVVHGLQDDQIVRITDLGSDMPTARGMDEIDGKRFRITVLSTTQFSIEDVISGVDIDSTSYTAWVSGGRVTLETRVLQLNNPQVSPYSSANPYNPNQFEYDPIDYKLTAGTDIMGADSDVFLIQAYGFGKITDLGDVGA